MWCPSVAEAFFRERALRRAIAPPPRAHMIFACKKWKALVHPSGLISQVKAARIAPLVPQLSAPNASSPIVPVGTSAVGNPPSSGIPERKRPV